MHGIGCGLKDEDVQGFSLADESREWGELFVQAGCGFGDADDGEESQLVFGEVLPCEVIEDARVVFRIEGIVDVESGDAHGFECFDVVLADGVKESRCDGDGFAVADGAHAVVGRFDLYVRGISKDEVIGVFQGFEKRLKGFECVVHAGVALRIVGLVSVCLVLQVVGDGRGVEEYVGRRSEGVVEGVGLSAEGAVGVIDEEGVAQLCDESFDVCPDVTDAALTGGAHGEDVKIEQGVGVQSDEMAVVGEVGDEVAQGVDEWGGVGMVCIRHGLECLIEERFCGCDMEGCVGDFGGGVDKTSEPRCGFCGVIIGPQVFAQSGVQTHGMQGRIAGNARDKQGVVVFVFERLQVWIESGWTNGESREGVVDGVA